MKKIGIISYFNYYNYGSMLQGYALQKCITTMSVDVDIEIINYRNLSLGKASKWGFLRMRLSRLFYYLSHMKEVRAKAKYGGKMTQRYPKFDSFLKEYTHTTDTFFRTKKQLMDNPPIYDIYVTGSDQTWSPKASGGYAATPMFLDFAIEGAKKVAYAPSLGVNSFTKEQESFIKDKLNNYSLISCREIKGAALLSKVTEREVPFVVDPTLLLTKEQWQEVMVVPNVKRPYIFCYFLGNRQYYRDFAIQLSKQVSLPIYYIPVSWMDYKDDENHIWNAGPLEFVGLINDAEYVCTDSFHGVVFSSNLNKNFYAFVKHSGAANAGDNSRLFDYLERIGLENRLLTEYDGKEIYVEAIDYSSVNERIAEEREKSYKYIDRIIQL